MESNFTPLDLNKLEKETSNINNILLIIVTITALIVAILLFVLIQKKINEKPESIILPTPTIFISPTPVGLIDEITPTASPSSLIEEKLSTPSPTIEVGNNETKESTISPTLSPSL